MNDEQQRPPTPASSASNVSIPLPPVGDPGELYPGRRAQAIAPSAVTLDWARPLPPNLVNELDRGLTLDPQNLFDSVVDVTRILNDAHSTGLAALTTWSLRWEGALSAAMLPGMADVVSTWQAPFTDPPEPGPGRDLYIIATVLVRALAGRWPHDRHDTLVMAGVLGGEWPLGADYFVRKAVHPRADHRALTASDLTASLPSTSSAFMPESRLAAAVESVTGWQKAQGRTNGDNEDVALWDRRDRTVVALLADGVSGRGNGTGLLAAETIATQLHQCWKDDSLHPAHWLQTCHNELRSLAARRGMEGPGQRPAATAIGLRITADGSMQSASVGDSVAFLCRPTDRGVIVSRLTPEDSIIAQRTREGHPIRPEDLAVVTRALGVGDAITPHQRHIHLHTGDIVVVVSDGASRGHSVDGGIDCWQFEDALEELARAHPSPALLASQLCRRAEELGGQDNATAWVAAIVAPHVGVDRPEPGWIRRMEVDTIA